MADLHYRQCVLERKPEGRGRQELVSWIPEKHRGVQTKPGVSCTLKDPLTKEEDPEPWVVVSVGARRIPEKTIREMSRQWAHWREVTDI